MKAQVRQTVIKLVLAAAILAGLVYLIEVDEIVQAAAGANPWWILAGGALLVPNVLLEATLWHLLVRKALPRLPFRQSLASLLFGHALGIFTPGRLGELAGRPLYLPGDDKWMLGLMVLAHRLYDMVAVLCPGVLMLLFFFQAAHPPRADLWMGVAVAGLVIALALCLFLLFPRRTYELLTRQRILHRHAKRLAFLNLLRTREAVTLLLLAGLRYVVYVTQFVFFLRAFAPDLSFRYGYMGVALVQFAKFLIPPVTFSDIGIREGAAVFFFGYLGVAAAAAFNGAILIYFINLLLPACLGLPLVLRLRIDRGVQPDIAAP